MPFHFVAAKKDGTTVKGTSSLPSRDAVANELLGKGLIVVSIESFSESRAGKRASALFTGSASHVEKVLFTKQLAVMLRAGLTLFDALRILSEQGGSRRLRIVANRLRERVERGDRLADALAGFPKVFTPFYVNVVRSAELSGTLEENLDHLAAQFTKEHELRKKVQNALLYPSIVLVAALFIGFFFASYVLPQVAGLFKQLKGVELPLVTRILLAVSEFTRKHTFLSFVGTFGTIGFLLWFVRRKFLAPFTHAIILKLPVVGKISTDVNMARFSLVFGTLMKSGVDIVRALEVTASVIDNYYYRKAVLRMVGDVQRGGALSDSLGKATDLFPGVASRMIAVGEGSGKLEEVLGYLRDFYELEVDTTMKNLSTVLEPLLLLFIGAIALAMAFAILIPIYNFIAAIRKI